jgi:hypothetical protein
MSPDDQHSQPSDEELQRRREWFARYVQQVESGVSRSAKAGVLYSCPCCGYPTLSERGGYEICDLCWWEDDGQDDHDADVFRGGPNKHYSLSAARTNWGRYGSMYDPGSEVRALSVRSEDQARLKHRIIELLAPHRWSPEVSLPEPLAESVHRLCKELRTLWGSP